jgi:hypothetical protein
VLRSTLRPSAKKGDALFLRNVGDEIGKVYSLVSGTGVVGMEVDSLRIASGANKTNSSLKGDHFNGHKAVNCIFEFKETLL